jgi:hypothetical protein
MVLFHKMGSDPRFVSFLLGFLFLLPLACSSAPEKRVEGEERVVERSSKSKPDWVGKRFYEEGDYYYFVGRERSRDPSLGEDAARLQAMSQLASAFESVITQEIRKAKGEVPQGLVGFIKDFSALAVKQVPVQGAVMQEVYWEKVERVSYRRAEYLYDVWALVRISKDDFELGLQRALDERRKARGNDTQEVLDALSTIEKALTPKGGSGSQEASPRP